MFPTAVTASLSYFRSHNPRLRANVVVLLTEVLSYTQTTDQEMLGEDTVGEVVSGLLTLLQDRDKDVSRTAAENLGRVLLLTTK